MDPAEKPSGKKRNNEYKDRDEVEEPTDDLSRTADGEVTKSDAPNNADSSLPAPLPSDPDAGGQVGATTSSTRAQRPPRPSPTRLVLQEAFKNAGSLSPKANNLSPTTTVAPSSTPTGSTNNATDVTESRSKSEELNDVVTEAIKNAVGDVYQTLSEQMSFFQAQMESHSEQIERKLIEHETTFNDAAQRSLTTKSNVPPPPQNGGPPPFHRAPVRRDDRMLDQIAEMRHSINTAASTTRRYEEVGRYDHFDDEIDEQWDDYDRSQIRSQQFSERFASSNQRFTRPAHPAPSAPMMYTQRLNPRVSPFVPRTHERKYRNPDASQASDFDHRPHMSMNDGNTVLNNSVGSINLNSRQSNYYHHDTNSTSRTPRRHAGQSFMNHPDDIWNKVDSFADRTRRAIADRMEYTGQTNGETAEQNKIKSENLRRLNPTTILHQSAKGLKTLTKALPTFNPWKDWWELLFRSCHLECITMMERRLSPANREGWIELDRSDESSKSRALTYNSIAYHGIPPTCSKVNDTFAELNGIFLGIIDAFPTLMLTLLTLMKSSIDLHTMSHISHYKIADSVSLRLMYFKALMIHTSPISDTRKAALKDFMQNTKYDPTMSPLEFLEKTIIRAEQVDAIFDREQVNDEMLWTVAIDAIEEAVGDRYDTIMDAHVSHPGFDTHDRNVLFSIFTHMDNKYKKKKKSNKSQYAMLAGGSANNDVEIANYAGGGKRDNRRHGDGNRKPASELPCFQMQRTGKCNFKNCKFSHNKQLLASAPPPPPTPENMALIADQLIDVQQALAAVTAKYKKTKNWKKKFTKKKDQSDKKSNRLTFDPSAQSYQKVTGTAKANAAIDHSQDPNVDTPQIALTEEESDRDPDDGDATNDSDDETTTDSSSDQE